MGPVNRYAGNHAPMPGVLLDQPAIGGTQAESRITPDAWWGMSIRKHNLL